MIEVAGATGTLAEMYERLRDDLTGLLATRRGHFLLESGHHGDLWLDLELLFLRPRAIRPFARALAQRLSPHKIELVSGPLVEGAFVAQLVAAELDVTFAYAERVARTDRGGLFPVDYRIPEALRAAVSGRDVAIVDDAINAGSAVRGTFADLRACDARPVAIGALLTLGTWASEFATDLGIPLETIATLPNRVWPPSSCPLCAARTPLDVAGQPSL